MGITARVLIDAVAAEVPGNVNATVGLRGVNRNTSTASGTPRWNNDGQYKERDQIQRASDSG